MTRPQALFALQQADSEIDSRTNRITRINAILADTQVLQEAQQNLAEAEKTLRVVTIHQKNLEQEAADALAHADSLEKKLYGGEIKGAKEAEKAQTEIATFRQRKKEFDDKAVTAMVQVEAQAEVVKRSKESLANLQAEWDTNQVALTEERAKLEGELPALQTEREKRKQAVVTPDLALYEKLRVTKNGMAVAQVENSGKLCGKCRVDLPVAKIRDVKNPSTVVTCPSCGRILFWK